MQIRTGTARSGDLDIYYEDMGEPTDPAVLLIMGLGAQLLLWRDGFCEKLVDQGLRVIRYDNRDVGLSSKTERRGNGGAMIPSMLKFFAGHSAARRTTGSRTWPTTPPRCSITSASTAPTSSARRWAA